MQDKASQLIGLNKEKLKGDALKFIKLQFFNFKISCLAEFSTLQSLYS